MEEKGASTVLPTSVWPGVWRAHGAVVDIVDACNLQCPECVRGSRTMKNTRNRMDLALFDKICRKFLSEGITSIVLYNWTEPFLHPEIDKFVALALSYGMDSTISSNLSLKSIPALVPTFEAGLKELIVSVSGFQQKTQEVYHRNSDVAVVKKHLRYIASKGYGRKTTIKFLGFGYNDEEAPLWSKVAQALGMTFVSEKAAGDPLASPRSQVYFTTIAAHESVYIHQEKEYIHYSPSAILQDRGKVCEVAVNPTLDCYGNVYLCCDRPSTPLYCLGKYLDLSWAEMLLMKYLHPECRSCSAVKNLSLSPEQRRIMGGILFE